MMTLKVGDDAQGCRIRIDLGIVSVSWRLVAP